MRKTGWEMDDQPGTESPTFCVKVFYYSHFELRKVRRSEDKRISARGWQRWDSD